VPIEALASEALPVMTKIIILIALFSFASLAAQEKVTKTEAKEEIPPKEEEEEEEEEDTDRAAADPAKRN
jgi:hypothetical protein